MTQPPATTGPRLRRLVVLIAFALPAAAAVLTLTRAHDLATTSLVVGTTGTDAVTWSQVPVGQTRCLALVTVAAARGTGATLDSVTLTGAGGSGAPQGVRVGSAGVLTGSPGVPADAPTCPSSVPVHGYAVPPGPSTGARSSTGAGTGAAAAVTLVVPLTITSPGKHEVGAVVVRYEVDGRLRAVDHDLDVRLCTSSC